MNEQLFNERIQRLNTAIALKEPDRLPMAPMVGGTPFHIYGQSSMLDAFYHPEACFEPVLRYHREFEPDIQRNPSGQCGKANEIAQSNMIDWPGRPGSIVNDMSTYQVIEREYMSADEYDELLGDYTGFMMKKYIPRAYPGLAGLAGLTINPTVILGVAAISAMFAPPVLEALHNIEAMAAEEAKFRAAFGKISKALTEEGFPPQSAGGGEVPFDMISDYFRGTAGMFDDQMECPEKIAAVCDMFADQQIATYARFKNPMPVKRVFFPLHKGMDGFMSPQQYDTLYWRPYEKMLRALVALGVTPIIYTEGRYDSRISYIAERLSDPELKGKCWIHFEKGDFAVIKEAFTGIACVSGGMAASLLAYGTKTEVENRMKWLIDTMSPGGGYIFDVDCVMENAAYENMKAMFDTGRKYGTKP
jgi:hypothetical protein